MPCGLASHLKGATIATKRSVTVALVLGFGLLLPALAMEGISAVRRPPRVASSSQPAAPWVASIAAMDAALARQDLRSAEKAWHAAHSAALHDCCWAALVEVGDARM